MFNIVNSFVWNPIWTLALYLGTLVGVEDKHPTDIDLIPSGLSFAA